MSHDRSEVGEVTVFVRVVSVTRELVMSFFHGANKSSNPALSNVNSARLFFRNSLSTVSFVVNANSTRDRLRTTIAVVSLTVLFLMQEDTYGGDQQKRDNEEHENQVGVETSTSTSDRNLPFAAGLLPLDLDLGETEVVASSLVLPLIGRKGVDVLSEPLSCSHRGPTDAGPILLVPLT